MSSACSTGLCPIKKPHSQSLAGCMSCRVAAPPRKLVGPTPGAAIPRDGKSGPLLPPKRANAIPMPSAPRGTPVNAAPPGTASSVAMPRSPDVPSSSMVTPRASDAPSSSVVTPRAPSTPTPPSSSMVTPRFSLPAPKGLDSGTSAARPGTLTPGAADAPTGGSVAPVMPSKQGMPAGNGKQGMKGPIAMVGRTPATAMNFSTPSINLPAPKATVNPKNGTPTGTVVTPMQPASKGATPRPPMTLPVVTSTVVRAIYDCTDPRLAGTELCARLSDGSLDLDSACATILRTALAAGATLEDLRQNELCASFRDLLVPARGPTLGTPPGANGSGKSTASAPAVLSSASVATKASGAPGRDVTAADFVACARTFAGLKPGAQYAVLTSGSLSDFPQVRVFAEELAAGRSIATEFALWFNSIVSPGSAALTDFCNAVVLASRGVDPRGMVAPSGAPYYPTAERPQPGRVLPQPGHPAPHVPSTKDYGGSRYDPRPVVVVNPGPATPAHVSTTGYGGPNYFKASGDPSCFGNTDRDAHGNCAPYTGSVMDFTGQQTSLQPGQSWQTGSFQTSLPGAPAGPSTGDLALQAGGRVAQQGLGVLGGYLAGETQTQIAQTNAQAAVNANATTQNANIRIAEINAARDLELARLGVAPGTATPAQVQQATEGAIQHYDATHPDPNADTGMSTGAKVGIVAAVVAVGLGVGYVVTRKKAA